jgi:hypothetical protein
MAGKGIYIRHHQGAVLRPGAAAYALAMRNAGAGNRPLKRPQLRFSPGKTGPQPVECAVQCSQVGQGGNLVVFVLYQCQCLRQQGLVFSSLVSP